jgi:RNA polymerase sigma factor (sigma-70 family)
MSDDQALLLRYARSRDSEAFAKLVKRYSSLVFSVAQRVTGNITTAEDVTQECFFALARQADSIKGSLPAWLHRVTLNLSLNVSRKEAARQSREARILPGSSTSEEPTWKQISPFVDVAMAKLPDELREPLVQHFLLDRSQAEIAENLQIDQGTVSRRLQKGIERIRTHLKDAGVICSTAALSTIVVKNASASVPARLSVSLAKMAIAGPTKIAATASITASIVAILIAKAKLIAAIAAVIFVGAVLTHQLAPSFNNKAITASNANFRPRPYLSKLVLQGDGYTQDSFSLAFQAAAKVFGRDADYESIYALSTNAFCPAIDVASRNYKAIWHKQAWLGNKAINTLCARYGLVAKSIDRPGLSSDEAAYRHAIAPIINQEMDAGNVVLVAGVWQISDNLWSYAGIITDVQSDGNIFGATLNGRQDNLMIWPRVIYSLAPAAATLTPREADIATLRSALARIRSQSPFMPTSQSVYGLKAMDSWIREMSETPGFCPACMKSPGNIRGKTWNCAYLNALTAQNASTAAARFLRRIVPDFPPVSQSHLQSAAARYDHITALLAPMLAQTGPDSYVNILGDLSRQKSHAVKVLTPIKNEYSAIAQDIELAITNLKP